jgi:hypothetical protein
MTPPLGSDEQMRIVTFITGAEPIGKVLRHLPPLLAAKISEDLDIVPKTVVPLPRGRRTLL